MLKWMWHRRRWQRLHWQRYIEAKPTLFSFDVIKRNVITLSSCCLVQTLGIFFESHLFFPFSPKDCSLCRSEMDAQHGYFLHVWTKRKEGILMILLFSYEINWPLQNMYAKVWIERAWVRLYKNHINHSIISFDWKAQLIQSGR